MDNPDNQTDDLRAVPNAVDLQSPDPKIVRRRFVQSTLFPLKAHDTKIENSGKKEVKTIEVIDDGNNNNGDDDECCGSQGGKRKRGKKPKRNATPQKRASKRVANGKDSPTVAVADIESSDDGSPQKPKERRRASTRNGRTNGNKGTSPAKLLNHSSSTHQASQPVPDLWLEAKRTAEENSKLFAGKQLHPFFSIRKVAKKDPETTEVEAKANGCLGDRKERNADCGPIHVFDVVKDDLGVIDWSNWTFDDGTFSKATCDHQRMTFSLQSPVCYVNSDTIGVLNPLGMSLLFKDMSSGQCSGVPEDTSVIPTSFTPLVVDEEVTAHNLLRNIEKDFEVGKLDFITGNVGHLISDIEQRNAILLERIMSYYLNRHNHPENSLWTCKYQPEKALEVCGNSEAVKFINEWLRLWHTTNFHVTKRSSGADKWLIREDDYDPYDSESDMENVDEASGLKNVLLVRGPVGSGKSAAIYACAREQGFQVVEVNASDWRNGALLKQKFGEALGSHRVKRSQESSVGSQSKLNLMSSPAPVANGTASLDLNCGLVEEISLLEEDNSSAGAADQSEIKTLILFEDVDATLCEDRGFVSTIQQLADTGKRPMILTGENPVLPDNLDREEVCFTMPSLKELMHHLYMICAAEKAKLQPHLIERCIQLCGGDIRKSLLYLQFWCQSQICVEDGKEQSLCSHLMFNLDAGHFTLPKLIPWELPSMLSEFIEAEITKSLYRIKMEENHSLLEVIEEEAGNPSMDNTLDPLKDETANIEAKKEEILRRNCFSHVDNDFMAIRNISELSNSSGSPIAFIRRNHRRKADTVLSDSEDDFHNHGNSAVADGLCDDGNNSGVPAVDSNFPIPYSAAVDTSCDPLYHSGAANVEVMNEFTGTAYLNQLNFSAVGDSCDQTIDHFVHCTEVHSAKNQHQLLQMVDANQNISAAVDDSLNPYSDRLLSFGEKKMETNNQLPVFGHAQNFSTMIDSRNLSPEQAIFFRQANTMETEVGNVNRCCQAATKHGLNPLIDQLEHCIETKVPVKRCLFSQAPGADPVSAAGGSVCNHSTDQLICYGESSLRELQPKHLEMEIVNHSNQEGKDDSLNPLFDQLVCHERANKENMEHQHLEGADVVPFGHLFVDSFNSSSEFHLVEAKGDEIKHQFPEARNNSSAAISDSLNQSSHHLIGLAGQDVQQQYPGSAEVNPVSFSPMGDSLKQMSDRLCFEDQKLGNQSPEIADVGIVRSPVPGKSLSPLTGKILQLSEENAEEHQCEFSEATKGNQVINHCQSVDISCVPESTFVPETEVNDGKELLSGADLVEFVSPVAADTVDSCFIRHKASEYMQCGRDINLNVGDEMGDSQSENEHIEASTSGCQVMDECSRMDFLKRSKIFRSSRLAAKNPVQERWDELRKTDMRQHSVLENKNALEVLELAHGISNLISEADLLFHNGKLLTNDSIDQEAELDEETFTFGWHDQQVQMASSTAHHGYCLFCKDIDTLRSKMGIDNRMHLAWEMLASTNNSMALGKLLRLERSWSRASLTGRSLKGEANSVDISSKRERESYLHDIVRSTVPAKCHMALRGYAFHDYLSSLAHISRSEASRLAEAAEKAKRRRVRITKNYLSSGGLDLSPEDISMLNEYYHSFRKVPSASCAISR